MNHQVAILLKKYCEIQGFDYRRAKKTFLTFLQKRQQAVLITHMKSVVEKKKLKDLITSL